MPQVYAQREQEIMTALHRAQRRVRLADLLRFAVWSAAGVAMITWFGIGPTVWLTGVMIVVLAAHGLTMIIDSGGRNDYNAAMFRLQNLAMMAYLDMWAQEQERGRHAGEP